MLPNHDGKTQKMISINYVCSRSNLASLKAFHRYSVDFWPSKNDINSNTFELNLLLLIDSLKKKDFKQANKRFKEFQFNKDDGTYEYVIYKILWSGSSGNF